MSSIFNCMSLVSGISPYRNLLNFDNISLLNLPQPT
jgi:hypothetical protein